MILYTDQVLHVPLSNVFTSTALEDIAFVKDKHETFTCSKRIYVHTYYCIYVYNTLYRS